MSAMREKHDLAGETRLLRLRDVVSFESRKIGGKFHAVPEGSKASESCVLRVVANDPDEMLAKSV